MTEIKDLNVKIGEFVGPDPETLINMGKVHVEFKEDVADLLKKAFVDVKKMEVKVANVLIGEYIGLLNLNELLDFAEFSSEVREYMAFLVEKSLVFIAKKRVLE
jgi:hypothetical protein